jgi:hypothetical protein
VFLSPSEVEGVASHVLATGPVVDPALPAPWSQERVADLYLFDDVGGGAMVEGLAASYPVVRAMEIPGQDPTKTTLASDSRGRLLVVRWNPAAELPKLPFELWRLDVAGGAAEYLAETSTAVDFLPNANPRLGQRSFLVSPGLTQAFVADYGFGWVFGPSARQFLWQANSPAFIDENLYCAGLISLDQGSGRLGTDIVRVRPDRAPEVILSSTGNLSVVPVVGDRTPQLVLILHGEQGSGAFGLLDAETLASRSLPSEKGQATFLSASSDGHLLLFLSAREGVDATQAASYGLFIYDWTTEVHAVIDSAVVGNGARGIMEWRPGTHELWFATAPDGFAIWEPGQPLRRQSGTLAQHADPFGRKSAFARDGRYWFSDGGGDRPTLYLGFAAEPTAPLLALNPLGTKSDRHFETGDGRLLVEAWASDYRRNDVYLVDPEAGTIRPLGSAGQVVAAGRTRALALVNWQLSRSSGRLALLDYATGASTVLAEDVYAVDVDRGRSAVVPRGTDALAPGTRCAFLLRNRLESRDDGLWVAELP